MPQVEIPARVFDAARQRAADSGFASVDEFISDLVSQELEDKLDDLVIQFTPERLAQIDQGLDDLRQGRSYTAQQAEVELQKRRSQWLKDNPSHQ